MKYVLDSSVALKWVLPEPDSAKAIQLRADSQNGIHELLAPNIFYVEAAHALTRAERQRRIAVSTGWRLWRTIMADCPGLSDSFPLMRRAFELSYRSTLGSAPWPPSRRFIPPTTARQPTNSIGRWSYFGGELKRTGPNGT